MGCCGFHIESYACCDADKTEPKKGLVGKDDALEVTVYLIRLSVLVASL